MRLTCARNHIANARLQLYVDDPALTVGGVPETRARIMIRTVLIWLGAYFRLWAAIEAIWSTSHVSSVLEQLASKTRQGLVVGLTPARAAQLDKPADES